MSVPSWMLPLPTWLVIPNVTSLQASESGVTHYDSPDGLTTGLSGPEAARANLSARQVKERGSMTSGTYGPRSTISSNSVALQQSLESKLQDKLQNRGSTLYQLTWTQWVTPSGRSFSRLRASALRTSETGCIGWPTPATMDALPPRCDVKLARAKSVAGCSNLKDVLPKPSSDEMERRVRVNPALSRGLMSLPECWGSCAPTEMPSTRKRRKFGSKP